MAIKATLSALRDRVYDVAKRPAKQKQFQAQFAAARQAGGPVKVNMGSGGRPLSGWINTDVVWRGDTYLDATAPWPVPAGSIDVIYADNVIEHITIENGRKVFEHAFTALAPGGVFRLATPDIEAVARQYLENGELAQQGLARNRERGRDFIYPVQLVYQVYVGAKHYLGFIYDYHALSSEMERAGFEVRRVEAGVSEHPALAGLEARMHVAEVATQLIVEGRKPG